VSVSFLCLSLLPNIGARLSAHAGAQSPFPENRHLFSSHDEPYWLGHYAPHLLIVAFAGTCRSGLLEECAAFQSSDQAIDSSSTTNFVSKAGRAGEGGHFASRIHYIQSRALTKMCQLTTEVASEAYGLILAVRHERLHLVGFPKSVAADEDCV